MLSPFRSPIDSPISFGLSGIAGLNYPPARDKLLIWADGSIQDGAYVWQDPDDVQDPNAPFGIWRKDRQVLPVEYSMKTSHSHCVEHRVGDSIIVTNTPITINGAYSITFYLQLDAIGTVQKIFDGDDANDRFEVQVDATGLIGDTPTYIDSITVDGVSTNDISDLGIHEITISGTASNLKIGTFLRRYDLVSNPLFGLFFNLNIQDATQDITFPMAEGAGQTLYSTDGLHSASITGNVWDSYQDFYHYNVASGFWMNGDGVKYPYAVSGFTSAHPAGKWNDSENKYEMRNEPALVAADLLETTGFFFSDHATTPVVIPRTQAEIEAYCVGKASIFWSNCTPTRGLSLYDEVLSGSELTQAQAFNCI